MFLFFLTFEAGHVLKVVLKLWSNFRLNVLMNFVLKKKKKSVHEVVLILTSRFSGPDENSGTMMESLNQMMS